MKKIILAALFLCLLLTAQTQPQRLVQLPPSLMKLSAAEGVNYSSLCVDYFRPPPTSETGQYSHYRLSDGSKPSIPDNATFKANSYDQLEVTNAEGLAAATANQLLYLSTKDDTSTKPTGKRNSFKL